MSERKIDRRVGKTCRQLRQGLVLLMREKRVQDITVRELTELCDLNRGTFYLHYKDVFDMVAQIERGMIEDFKKMLFSFSPQDVFERPRQIFLQFFELMRDNNDIVSVLVGPNGDLAFINQIKDLVRDKRMTRPGFSKIGSDQNIEYFTAFMVSGFVGLFETWFSRDMAESPEEMAQIAEWLVLRNPDPAQMFLSTGGKVEAKQ